MTMEVQMAIRDSFLSQHEEGLQKVYTALLDLDERAAELMAEIIAASPSQSEGIIPSV
jgi:hypothetical protein